MKWKLLENKSDWLMLTVLVLILIVGAFVETGSNFSGLYSIAATLFSTFIGAKLAFSYQIHKEAEEERRKQITAGNLAIFKVSTMISQLFSYKIQVIDPYKDRTMRFIEMPPTVNKFDSITPVELDTLSFLFQSEERNLLGEISAIQSHYFSIGETIKDRSEHHRFEVQPMLDEAGVVEGHEYLLDDIQKILGERVFAIIVKSTDETIEHVEGCIVDLVSAGKRLTLEMKKLFPDDLILSLKDPTKQNA